MKASTFAISLFVLGLFTCCATAAEVRTWTDASGKTLSGSLEDVTSDGKVVIKSGGQSFTIPIERFSAEDKAYIDSHKDQMGDKDSSPGRRRKSDLFDYRQWKDKDDNEIKAKYVRMFEGKVVLLQGRTSHKVSFYDLSDEDQIYLRRELEERGEDSQIPPPTAIAGATGVNPITGGNQAYDPRLGNQAAMPAYAPPEMDDFAKRQQEEHERNRREIEKQQAEARRIAEEQKRRRDEENRRREQEEQERIARRNQQMEQQRQEQLARMNGPQMEMQWVEYKICSNCNNELDKSITAGDRCPHCNVFIAEEQDRFGNTTKKVDTPWAFKGGLRGGAVIGGIIGIIVGFVKWLFRGSE